MGGEETSREVDGTGVRRPTRCRHRAGAAGRGQDGADSVRGTGGPTRGPARLPALVSAKNKGSTNGEAGHLLVGTGFIRRNVQAQRARDP